MNGFQRKLVNKLRSVLEKMNDYEQEFIVYLYVEDKNNPDTVLTDRQNKFLNNLSDRMQQYL